MARFSGGSGGGSGTPGPRGPRGLPGEGFNFRGEWVTDTAYLKNDVVTQGGSSYIANYDYQDTDGPSLDGDLWAVLALKGADGEGGGTADIADFIFTSEEGQSSISLPGDKQMRIGAGEEGDLYLDAGDDLYLTTLGDDIHIRAGDDIRFTASYDGDEGTEYYWRMNSEGRFQLPGDGYISNPYQETTTPSTYSTSFNDNYLNDQSGLTQANAVYLPVDQNTLWFQNNSSSFTSPVTITFADTTTVQTIAIFDATSQGTPAVIFQWDGQLDKAYADTFPLNISVDYNQINSGPSVIILDPVEWDGGDQHIVIDATAPNHIHIRAGGEIDQSTADLIIGGEETSLLVSDTGDYVDVRTTSESSTNVWRFNSDGYLTGPAMGGLFVSGILNGDGDLYIQSSDNKVVISGDSGEFLRDLSIPENQIATIGDVNAARFGGSASYHSRSTQGPQASANLVQPFTFSTTDWQTGIERIDNTKIKMLSAGKYNIAFSAQLVQANNNGTVNIWLNKNGTPMAYTNTKVVVESNATYTVAAWNFFVDAAADDYYELIWSSSSTNTTIQYDPAQTINGNLHPEIPSIIVTVNQVG